MDPSKHTDVPDKKEQGDQLLDYPGPEFHEQPKYFHPEPADKIAQHLAKHFCSGPIHPFQLPDTVEELLDDAIARFGEFTCRSLVLRGAAERFTGPERGRFIQHLVTVMDRDGGWDTVASDTMDPVELTAWLMLDGTAKQLHAALKLTMEEIKTKKANS